MPLNPNIILEAGRFPKIDAGEMLERRAALQQRNMQLAALARREQEEQGRKTRLADIGRRAAAGDLEGAGAAALEEGDWTTYEQIQGLAREQRETVTRRIQAAAPLAYAASRLPYEQRRQLIGARADVLQAGGWSPEEIAAFDPSDENLMSFVASAQTLADQIRRADEAEKQAYTREKDTLDRDQDREAAYVGAGYFPPEGLGGTPGAVSPSAPGGKRDAPAAPVGNAKAIAESIYPGIRVTDSRRDPNSRLGRANPGSWHVRSGAAVDSAPIPGMSFDEYVQGYRDKGFAIIEARDEVKNPSGHATGPHWHVVLGKGSGGGGAQPGLRPIPGGKADPNKPAKPSTRAQWSAVSAEEARAMGLPDGVVYQRSNDGEVKPVSGQSGSGGPLSYMTKKQVGDLRGNVVKLGPIRRQIDRLEKAMIVAEKDGYTGFVGGRVPGGLDAESDAFDAAAAQLKALARQIIRTPGEGAISDYETRLQNAAMPSRSQTKAGRREAITQLREMIAELDAGYRDLLGSAAPASRETPAAKSDGPAIGTVKNGYRFKGGNPGSPQSWEKVR